MQTRKRRWMGMGLLSWAGVLLLACASSSCLGNIEVAGYPTFLGNNADPNVVIWPLDASGTRFNSLATPATQELRADDQTVTFDWPGDLAPSLPARIGSVTILLAPSPSADLRARVNELLREIEQSNPNVNTSITVCAQSLDGVNDGASFAAAVRRLYDASMEQRAKDALEPLVELELPWMAERRYDERRIVLPNAAIPGEYFVVTGQGSALDLPLFNADFDHLQSVGHERVLQGLSDRTIVFLLAPWDMQSDVRKSMSELMAELTPQPRAGDRAKARWVPWPVRYDELTSIKAAQLSLQGRISDCSCQYCKLGAEL